MQNDLKSSANFLFEVGILNKTPRSGFHFLGSGEQSVAEHVHRAVYCGFVLAQLDGTVDVSKVIQMCLLHDLTEARISDLNYVHQKYNKRDEQGALADIAASVPFGKEIAGLLHEYEERKSPEALIAKDADNIEWILSLKEQVDCGSTRAEEWLIPAIKRLKTEVAQKLATEIMQTKSDEWWFNREDQWWVDREKGKKPRHE